MAYPYGGHQGGFQGAPGGHPGMQPHGGHPGMQPPGGHPGMQPPGGHPGMQPPAGHPGMQGYGGPPSIDPQVVQWFYAVDTDHSGHISASELQAALTNANWTNFNAETCRLMIGMFDQDHSGTISLQEFGSLWTYIQQWRGVFEQFDRDRSGAIDSNELLNALQQMGYRMSSQFTNLVVRKYDVRGMGNITLDSFIQSCVLLKSLTDAFRSRDTQQQGVIQLSYEDFMTLTVLNKP